MILKVREDFVAVHLRHREVEQDGGGLESVGPSPALPPVVAVLIA